MNHITFLGTLLLVGGGICAGHRDFQQARLGHYPYVVYINSSAVECSGSIIAPRWLLTAARCVPKQARLKYAAGVVKVVERDLLDADHAVVHEEVAVVFLVKRVVYSDLIRAVDLSGSTQTSVECVTLGFSHRELYTMRTECAPGPLVRAGPRTLDSGGPLVCDGRQVAVFLDEAPEGGLRFSAISKHMAWILNVTEAEVVTSDNAEDENGANSASSVALCTAVISLSLVLFDTTLCCVIQACALDTSLIKTRIVGGSKAKLGEYPYIVYLKFRFEHKDGPTAACTGSILSPRWILTAGHCAYQDDMPIFSVNFAVGVVRVHLDRLVSAESVVLHPFYQEVNYPGGGADTVNDLALVKTRHDLQFGEFVDSVLLVNVSLLPRKGVCTAVGFGQRVDPFMVATEANYDLYQTRMKYELVEQPARAPYKITLRTLYSFPSKGDSGGPLMCHGFDVGVASLVGVIGVEADATYTSAIYFKEWIETTVGLDVFEHKPRASSNKINRGASHCVYLAPFPAAMLPAAFIVVFSL